jgi:hypothetical protein
MGSPHKTVDVKKNKRSEGAIQKAERYIDRGREFE